MNGQARHRYVLTIDLPDRNRDDPMVEPIIVNGHVAVPWAEESESHDWWWQCEVCGHRWDSDESPVPCPGPTTASERTGQSDGPA